jgi:hypothetical protein
MAANGEPWPADKMSVKSLQKYFACRLAWWSEIMAAMNSIRAVLAFLRFNWSIIALCALVAIVLAGLVFHDRNRNRFVPFPGTRYALDTSTGQWCDPYPRGGSSEVPLCSDLAKRWR